MSEFKVSVIIPVYNAEKYIRKAIESALLQDETGEIIVIEDKSPDKSLQLCLELAFTNPRIKVYQHEDKQNHGASATRNLGISLANYDFISFLDADDYYLPKRFLKDKELFESSVSIDGVYSAVGTDYYETVEKAAIPKNFLTTIKEKLDPKDLFFFLVKSEYGWIHCNGLTVKKNIFKKVGLFDIDLKISQDTDLLIRMAALTKLVPGEIEKPVAMRGVHMQNRINDAERLIYFNKILFNKLFNWSIEKKLPYNKKKLLWKLYYQTNIDNLDRTPLKRFTSALNEVYRYPFLLGYLEFYKIIPFLNRFIKKQETGSR